MKNLIFWTVALTAVLSINACFYYDDPFNCERGQGPTTTRTLSLPSFSGIDLTIAGKVILKQGPVQLVEVEGQENIIDLLRLNVKNDTWEIRFDDCVRNYQELVFYITIPEIGYLSISGSASIEGDNLFEGQNLILRISGSGNMDLGVDYDNVDSRISGSGDIRLEGVCDRFDLLISGSGDYHAFQLESNKGNIRISGSGNAEVNVANSLDVNISGSGSVYYLGNPYLDVQITGSGRVKNAN